MVEVHQTEWFFRWLAGLRDLRGRAKVLARIERLIGGNPGDVKPIGGRRVRVGDQLRSWMKGLLPAEGIHLDHPFC
jgi:putative component of toxin-antitoxin plasmid stabilization module